MWGIYNISQLKNKEMGEIKQTVVGGIGVLSGVILFGLTLVAAAIYSIYVATDGYYTNLGVYGTALKEIGIFPLVISAVLFVAGVYFLISGSIQKKEK